MSTEVQTVQSKLLNVSSSFRSQSQLQKQLGNFQRSKKLINPHLSILHSSIDPKMSKLEIYKQHLLNIQLRKQALPQVPQPSIISCFNMLKQQKSFIIKKEKLKKQIQVQKQQYQKLKKTIDKYTQTYASKEQSLKQKLLLSKILSTKLESQFDKTKQKFRQLQVSKIMNIAQKKLYFYQLAEIFFNEQTRSIFSFDKQMSRTDEQFGTCLGYLALLILNVSRIAGVEMWLKLRFRGSRSTITVYDTKMIQQFSNTSTSQNSNVAVLEQCYLLHPKEQRLNQALVYLCEQLKQVMKYSLAISVGKSNNFYQLCEQLSQFLLNA